MIGHSANPRCLRGLASHLHLPVTYVSNRQAWMTSELFQSWLDSLNNKMRLGRSFLLFVDNLSAHPDVIRSNIKLVFLPPNTTSKLQPCDAGIIQNLKMDYRKQLLRHVLNRMDEATCPSELAKKVNILDAILWLKNAWDAVDPTTIEKCFAKCGFVDILVDTAGEAEAKLSSQLGTLLTSAGMTWDEYADCDQELATSQTFEDDWERNLLATLNEEQTSDFG